MGGGGGYNVFWKFIPRTVVSFDPPDNRAYLPDNHQLSPPGIHNYPEIEQICPKTKASFADFKLPLGKISNISSTPIYKILLKEPNGFEFVEYC